MVDKIFGLDFTDESNPTGSMKISVYNGTNLVDVELQNLYKALGSVATQTLLDLISSTQGVILYHNGTDWVALSPGTSGQVLKTLGAGQNPAWGLAGDLSITSQAQGDILYFNGTNWVRLAASSIGKFLKTQSTGANPMWDYVSEWVEVSDSWSYASASTITVPTDATTKYRVGDRIRWKQGGGYKYGNVAAIAATLLTIDVNTDYTVANSAITDVAFSRSVSPFGFPAYFNWSPTSGGYSVGNGTQVARFFRTGKIIDFWYSFTLGSTSTITGDFNLTLPVTPSPDFQALADITDAGTAGYVAFGITGTGILYIRAVNVTGTYPTNSTTFSSTVPFTWTTNDNVRAGGRYLTA